MQSKSIVFVFASVYLVSDTATTTNSINFKTLKWDFPHLLLKNIVRLQLVVEKNLNTLKLIGLLETDVSRLACTILSDCSELLRNFLLSCQFTDRFTRNRCSKARMHQGQLRSKALKDIVARRRGHSPNINMILNNTFHNLAFAKRNKNIL